MDQVQYGSCLLGRDPGNVLDTSEECVVCGTRQPRRRADFLYIDLLSDFSRSLWHIVCFVCLVKFPLAVVRHQLDTQCLYIICHPHLDIPGNQKYLQFHFGKILWMQLIN